MISTSGSTVAVIEKTNSQKINDDPSGRTRVSQITTLFDGKVIDKDDPNIWTNEGTGTFTFVKNQMQMSVGVGEYCIRESAYRSPYSSGKPQFIEATMDNFDADPDVIKYAGYFSSSHIAPYDTEYDGVWVENDNGQISLKASNDGTLTMNVPIEQWDNYSLIQDYDWSNFSVIAFDYLWLGGTSLRFFIRTEKGFVLLHEEPWSSTAQGTFINSPNQYVRYEMRSKGGTGNFNAVCSQVATEGAINTVGKSNPVYTTSGVSAGTIGTIYAIKSVRVNQSNRNIVSQLTDAAIINTAGNDAGVLLVLIDPITSNPATYTDAGGIEEGDYPSGTTLTAGSGRKLATSPAGRTGVAEGLSDNFLAFMGDSVAGVSNEYVLAYLPVTTNQTVYGTITVKEY